MSKNRNLFNEERRIQIVERVRVRRKVTVAELARAFRVSSATVRADLRALHRAGLLIRTHGGAIAQTATGSELTSEQKKVQRLAEKQSIARAALELVTDGDTILLDTGTTTLELARILDIRRDLTVVTNDIEIARVLEPKDGVRVMLTGGALRKGFHCAVGVHARQMLAGLNVDKAFMGTNGFSFEKGASTPDVTQAETKSAMIAAATETVLLCDSSKIGHVSFARFAAAEDIDILVTDSVEQNLRKKLEDRGIRCILGQPRPDQ